MINRSNQSRIERNQRKLDAGLMSKHFPEVESIVINMIYSQQGIRAVRRTLNFYPASYALFRVDCLSDDCVDGGFDMSGIINSMVRNHSETSKGELGCDDSGPRRDHSSIVYEVAIQYV
ncbi:MAG: hypothetical protein C4581_08050 [Nitrospiraceae bacterium]|nr:MAG: hypothetical protein C4581_08050 [Nitrospiraceae bacterium]